MGLDREAGMEDVLHQDLTTQVWARLGQVWATGREPAQKPPKVTPRTGETTRFPGAEGGNPSRQEEIQMGRRASCGSEGSRDKLNREKFQTERT